MGRPIVGYVETVAELAKLFNLPMYRKVRSFTLHASCDELVTIDVEYLAEEGDIDMEGIKKRFVINIIEEIPEDGIS
jgi:hypothetical protein